MLISAIGAEEYAVLRFLGGKGYRNVFIITHSSKIVKAKKRFKKNICEKSLKICGFCPYNMV